MAPPLRLVPLVEHFDFGRARPRDRMCGPTVDSSITAPKSPYGAISTGAGGAVDGVALVNRRFGP
jgi:hypothetical protein